MNVLNVLLQIIYIHNSLVSNCAGRGMVILDDMIQKDFVFCEVYGTDTQSNGSVRVFSVKTNMSLFRKVLHVHFVTNLLQGMIL